MAYLPARLYQGQPGTTETTVYTVPTGKTVILKQIVLANVTTLPAKVSVSLVPSGGTAGDGNRLCKDLSVPANSIVTIDLSQVMTAGDFLSAVQGTSGAITVTISGVVIG
ncbi:MAG TPA: hypothetical protein GXX40_05745 [Firmicutes bacterium]|nr:hypothetical protein [Bacillota bacterium]